MNGDQYAAVDTARPFAATPEPPNPDPPAVTHVNWREPTSHERDVITAAVALQRVRAADVLAGVLTAKPPVRGGGGAALGNPSPRALPQHRDLP